MNFPSIIIQGSILSADLFAKIRGEQALFQQGKDFIPDFTNAKLKDDISLAWQEAKGQWVIYKSKLARLKEGEIGTTETRNFWISPLLTNLNYNLTFNRQAEELNGKLFPIGFRDSSLDNFPLYVGGYHESLDKRPENKQLRVSPHAMLQEYLNYSEHLYGIVTNGKQLRLLRDASRITRLSYVEFDLEKIMEEDLYSDFVIFYRLMHASRMPKRIDGGAESIIEKYHQEGLEAGSTIRNKLGDAVKTAILNLANGFINDPNNIELRAAFENEEIDLGEYYRHQLRIIYRLLFLFVIEERNLVYAESKTPETKRFNQIYFNHYSLLRLRKLAKKIPAPEANRYNDLWQGLVSTFSLFENKAIGQKLGIMSLQGDLFGYNAIQNSYYDLHQCSLNNSILLNIIKSLSYFVNENQVLIAVNYGGLDVEEFGSVYEGLLELQLTLNKIEGSEQYSCNFDSSNERGKSGSHYTPEELVQPLIKHSLEYLIEDRLKPYQQKKTTKETTVNSLLQLKICDVACGSGHILLSAARRLALEIARVQTDEEQPNPLAIRKAMKDVVRNCIYGVDKNPLAIELCKIALWLEAYNPGEPLNFLDHHIKCGDAIVGLAHRNELENGIADEAFKTLAGDDKVISKSYRDKNVKERKERVVKANQLKAEYEKTTESSVQEAMVEYKIFNHLPESTPEEIEHKAKAYQKFIVGKGFTFLKAMADTQVAQFFIPKTNENKDLLMTDGDFRLILSGYKGWQDRKVAKATAVAFEQRIFHWFIEFPEVFNEGGFDCILGNPPYLGGKKISTHYGFRYGLCLKNYFETENSCDLVVYFFHRIFNIFNNHGFMSLITTNSISEAGNRIDGLQKIESKSILNMASTNVIWPGNADVTVTLITITRRKGFDQIFLNNKNIDYISSHLNNSKFQMEPFTLKESCDIASIGIYPNGDFLLNFDEYNFIISNFPLEANLIKKYLNGQELNNQIDSKTTKYIIDLNSLTETQASKYHTFKILVEKVKPYRDDIISKGGQVHEYDFWKFWDKRPDLTYKLTKIDSCFVMTRVSKYFIIQEVETDQILSDALVVFASNDYSLFLQLQSSFHEYWSWHYCSTMRNFGLRYTPRNAADKFPFIKGIKTWRKELFTDIKFLRSRLMNKYNVGLTGLYNLFHSKTELETEELNLLRKVHINIDNFILDTYGWNDIKLNHNFYEVEYLPENDRVRFTIHPDSRKEVLKRLLELNHKIHEEEVAAGLFDKKPSPKPKKKKDITPEQNQLF
jgi:hypothetical protein